MTNISKIFREVLENKFYINKLKIKKKLVSKIDRTIKYLYELMDGNFVESVLMRYKHGNSLCISSQVGCNMGCNFCASTLAGLVRNLSTSEILDQVYTTEKDTNEKISNIVMMGIGEPLNNFVNVTKFLNIISSPMGRNFSLRNLTLSTCGIVDKIYELSKLNLGLTLAISLHSPNDTVRSSIMPVNKKWNIEQLLKACYNYYNITKRRVSFEYAVILGVNDSKEHAIELAKRLKGFNFHVNLIPVNKIKERNYISNKNNIINFQKVLIQNGINTTIRRTLGDDISAACGQLRRENI